MNLAIKAAVGAVLLSAASMSAFATSVTPPGTGPVPVPGLVPGGLVVEVWDATTGTSMSEWLGPDISSFGAPSATPAAGTTLDYGVLGGSSTFSGLFSASEIAAGDVQFVVSAVNDVAPATPIVDFTASSLGTIRGSGVTGFAQQNNTGISAVMNGTTACNNANPCTAATTTSPGYAVNNLGTATLGGAKTAGTAGGSAIDFYQIVSTGSASGLQTPVQFANANGAATWTLSSTGDLVYSAPGGTAPVPLPAAVWLLGSGLVGLIGVGRRRAAKLAA